MSKDPSQPLRVVPEPPTQWAIIRELENIHKVMNDRLGDVTKVVIVVDANTVLANADSGNIFLIDTSSAKKLTLPQPALGLIFRFKDMNGLAATNNITIARFLNERIEGVLSNKVMNTNYQSLTLVSDGTNWLTL